MHNVWFSTFTLHNCIMHIPSRLLLLLSFSLFFPCKAYSFPYVVSIPSISVLSDTVPISTSCLSCSFDCHFPCHAKSVLFFTFVVPVLPCPYFPNTISLHMSCPSCSFAIVVPVLQCQAFSAPFVITVPPCLYFPNTVL